MVEDRSPVVLANTLVFGLITIATVALRISFRFRRWRLDLSDACIVAALILSIVQDVIIILIYTTYGYGMHRADLPFEIAHSRVPGQLFYANQIIFKLTTGLSKLSLCFVYYYLFNRVNTTLVVWTRRTNYAVAFIIASVYGSAFIVSIFQCNPLVKATYMKGPGVCIDIGAFRISTAIFNVITSILLIVIPLPALMSMKDKRPEIKQLLFLILLGLSHTACAITRLVFMFVPELKLPAAQADPHWMNTTTNTFAIVEMNIGITVAALVVMRPALLAFCSGFSDSITYLQNLFQPQRSTKSLFSIRSGRRSSATPSHEADVEIGMDAEKRARGEGNVPRGRMGRDETTVGETEADSECEDGVAVPRRLFMRPREGDEDELVMRDQMGNEESGDRSGHLGSKKGMDIYGGSLSDGNE